MVPEVTMDEDYRIVEGKNDVGSAREVVTV
jgi:hypothetical protein